MNKFIKYWSYLVENEDKEISFETFLDKKSSLFEASMKWPDDYLKKAKDRILKSPLGKSSWYLENYIDQDLQTFYDEFKTFAKKGNFTLGFFLSIINWFIEYSGNDIQKYQEFIEGKLDKIIGILNFIVNQKDDEISQFHGFSKEKDENGNPLLLRFKKLKEMNWNTFDKEIFQKYSDQISKSVELDKDSLKKSDYEIIPIYSYDELHDKFGGNKTGYKGESEWCHANRKDTYDSRAWTNNGTLMFIVFAKRGWENITPLDPDTTNAFDNYGTSLIVCLFDTGPKELLHSTLRWNHVIDPAKTKLGASVDNAFLNENDLMNTIGIDLSTELNEYFTKFRELRKGNYIIIGGKEFVLDNGGDIDCSFNNLSSLKGAPEKVDGHFNCRYNQLTSLEGAPKEVSGFFNCSDNHLTSLEGTPQTIGSSFNCSVNKLTSLKGSPQEVNEFFYCYNNQLTSLEGAPQKVGKGFDCSNNQLTSLKDAPQKVSGYFDCSENKLTSLEGAPKKIFKNFDCCYNQLTSLKGAPQEVGGNFYCGENQLTSLEGSPKKVSGDFNCCYNQLTSLEGAPQWVGGNFYFYNNKLTSLEGAPEYVGGDFEYSGNDDLPEYKIDAYRNYLVLSYSKKALLTKDNHYYPTGEWENKFKH